MAPPVASSPPRCIPFLDSEARLAFDDFQRANGPLIGTAAVVGGVWGVGAFGYTSIAINGNKLLATASATRGATLTGVLTAEELQNDWWIRINFLMTQWEVGAQKSVGVWIGTDGANVAGLLLIAASLGNVEWEAGNFDGGTFIDNGGPLDLTVEHEAVLQFRAADQSWHVIIDDVEVDSQTGVPIDLPTALDFTVYANCGAVAQLPSITEVELGAGSYV